MKKSLLFLILILIIGILIGTSYFLIGKKVNNNQQSNQDYFNLPFFTGFNMVSYEKALGVKATEKFNASDSLKILQRLKGDGVKYIEIVCRGTVDSADSITMYPDSHTLSDKDLITVIEQAKSLGIIPIIKPHLFVGGLPDTRGQIGTTWSKNDQEIEKKWFEGYLNYIMPYIDVSQKENLPYFIIAVELPNLVVDTTETGTRRDSEWRNLINTIRTKYNGKLTYAANSESIEKITWWDALDYIGIDAYFTLSGKDNPGLVELENGWTNNKTVRTLKTFDALSGSTVSIVDKLKGLSQKFNRPIVFTEIGYKSVGNMDAKLQKDKTRQKGGITENQDLQANSYKALFNELSDKPWFKGLFVWEEYIGLADTSDISYLNHHGVLDKSAEEVIREEYLKH